MLINEKAHQLRNCDRRVRIVELDNVELREVLPIRVRSLEAADDILKRAADEEILLDKAKLLAVLGRIVGIQDLGDRFTHSLLTDCFDIATFVEDVEVELAR